MLRSVNCYGAFWFIHRTLGTPDERLWPGVAELPDYKSSFPKWPVQNLLQVIPALSQPGADLLQVRNSPISTPIQRFIPTDAQLKNTQVIYLKS